MEPLAPGTEDEVIDYNSLTKKENEQERLLKQKGVLKNGQYANIFELSYVSGAEHWFCKVCECPIMGRVYQHELGKRHSQNIQLTNRHLGKDRPKEKQTDEEIEDIDVAPGEPVPPGFEEVNRRALIQERLDSFTVGPLVALEYLIEMHDYDPSKEPLYLCILCDKKGDPRTVLTHLASYNHISQYLQKHFPSCYRALAPYMTKQYKRNWQVVLQKIAEAIEKKFGRLKPFCISEETFKNDRIQYLTMISKGEHFSEHLGLTFVDLVVHEELTKNYDDEGRTVTTATSFAGKPFIEKPFQKRSPSPPVVARPTKKQRTPNEAARKPEVARKPEAVVRKPEAEKPSGAPPGGRRKSLSSVSSLSSDEEPNKERKMARNRSPPRRDARDVGRRPPYDRERRRMPSPPPRKPYERDTRRNPKDVEEERRRNREKERLEKAEEFKRLSKAIENDLEKTMKGYERNPEKHPKYNEEWKLFWNRRYKELQAEGKDASKYDFKPEWIDFWGKKMQDLHNEELKNRKEGLRRRLGLPEEPAPVSFRIGAGNTIVKTPTSKAAAPKENRPTLPMAARPDNDPEIIQIDDNDDPPVKLVSSNRERSHSPWESESPPPTKSRARRGSPSPGAGKRRPANVKPRERTPEKKRIVEKRRSLEKQRLIEKRRSPERRRSPEKTRRSRSRELLRRSRSRELLRRSKERSSRRSPARGLSRERRSSRSPDSYRSGSAHYPRDRDSRDMLRDKVHLRERERDARSGYSRERSWERDRVRESSFERDMRGKERIRTVADLPWEREKQSMYPGPEYEYYPPHYPLRDSRSALNFVPPPGMDDDEEDGEVNIVSVLRLLTALEEKLGSLGPKIIDLLAQALAMEKKEANSSEKLLESEINCVMFETVKEKLKGQLLAGLVDIIQERAFKKAIQKTANLIHIAGQRKKARDLLKPAATAAVAVPGVGAVDKGAIAKQLANALIAQGKTDVTQAELEQLIDAVVGMAEASKSSSKPMNTANFLAQLAGGESSKHVSETQKDKIILPRTKSSEDRREKSRDRDIADLDKLTEPLSPSTPEKSNTSNMENLSDSDLQTLLQNFKDLSTEEQMNLINYLKKMELDEPERVERLRKFVNLGSDKATKEIIDLDKDDTSPNRNGQSSPFSNRLDGGNPDSESFSKNKRDRGDDKPAKIHLDSEDEEYSYEDVVKAASKNIKQKEMEDNRKIVEDSIGFDNAKKEANLTDAKALITNLMSSLSSASSSGVNLLGLPLSVSTTLTKPSIITTSTSPADFAKTLSSINMDSLASIVSNVQSNEMKRLHFESPSESNLSPVNRTNEGMDSRLPNPLRPDRGPPIRSFTEPPGTSGPGPMSFQRPPPNRGIPLNASGPRDPSAQGHMSPGLGGPMGGGPPGSLLGAAPSGSLGPRPRGPGPVGGGGGAFPQRGPAPGPFGNFPRAPRPQYNAGFGPPRFGGPRGPNFNNRW